MNETLKDVINKTTQQDVAEQERIRELARMSANAYRPLPMNPEVQQAIKFANKKANEPDPNLYLESVKFETVTRLRFHSDDMIKALAGVKGDGLVLLTDETGAYTHNLYARHLVDLCKLLGLS